MFEFEELSLDFLMMDKFLNPYLFYFYATLIDSLRINKQAYHKRDFDSNSGQQTE